MTEDEQNKVYNTIGLAPNSSMPVKGDASSTTKSAVAAGTIDIRDNLMQDISALSRNTANSLNELGRIFDNAKIEEQQELAAVFGEEAFRLAHNLKDDGSGRKIAIHFALGGIMSAITGAGFASGAIGAGLNEALIKNLKGLDPGTAQIVSGIIGAATAKVVGGNALAGASAAASGTKWNYFGSAYIKKHNGDIAETAVKYLVKKYGSRLSQDEATHLINNLDAIMGELEPEKATSYSSHVENFSTIVYLADRLNSLGYTRESVDLFLHQYTNDTYMACQEIFTDTLVGKDDNFFNSTYMKIGFQPPNYIYDRSSSQSKEHRGIYGWRYTDDGFRAAINKNGNIFLDDQHKPVVWGADVVNRPYAAQYLKNKIDLIVKTIPSPINHDDPAAFSREVDNWLKHDVSPEDSFGVGRIVKAVRAVKPLTEPIVKDLSKAAADRVVNELRDFKLKVWTIGNQKVLLNKAGMRHILERHHPAFWAGETKPTQTFLSPKTSVKDIEYTIQEVISQNRDALSNITSLPKKQIEGVIDGITYVVGFTKGNIYQFYIKQ